MVNRLMRCSTGVAVLAILGVLHAASALAAPPARPRIGLALSGGGARGAAHIGVLRVLEEQRVPIDYIAGTSMGALVGGLYASGMSAAELDSVVSSIDWNDTFADNIPRGDRSFRRKCDDDLFLVKHKPGLRGGRLVFPPGILDGHRVDLLLKRLSLPVTTVRTFDNLSIPYRAVAADIVNGEAVVIDHGDLALAMRASMSIPTAFAPREIDGRLLVDGGIVDNLPIDLVRRMGADVIIAVDISTPPTGREGLYTVLAISTQLATLSSEQNKTRQIGSLAARDVFLCPDLGSITVASFERATDAVEMGARAARTALARLEPLALGPDEYRARQAARAAWVAARRPPSITAVRIVNRSRLADDVVAARVDAPLGRPLDVRRLERSLDQIYGLELFESVYYDVEPTPEGDVLTVTARERAWGPNYLQGGVAVFEDFEGPNFNVALAYSRTAINRLSGEWRSGIQVGQEPGSWTELYQPLDRKLRTFVELDLFAGERAIHLFDGDGHERTELGITRFGGSFAAGRELGTWGELRAGVRRAAGKTSVQVGDSGVPIGRYDTGEGFVQIRVDELDELAFPHRGGALRAGFSAGLEPLGSRVEYEQAVLDGTLFGTHRRWTGMLGATAATTLRSNAPFESRFRLGGLGQLSGLEQGELEGQHALLARAGLYQRIGNFQLLPVYVGMMAEFGNVHPTRSRIDLGDDIAAGSLFLGMDTMLGPLCAAYGRADGGRGNYYLTLGEPLFAPRLGLWSR